MHIKESSLPSLRREGAALPKIYVLEVHHREEPGTLLGHLLVEETEEIRSEEGVVYEARLNVNCEVIAKLHDWREGDTRFSGGFSRFLNSVSVISTSVGGDGLFNDLPDLRGQRIGTFLFSRIVAWVKQWEGMAVHPIKLGGNRGVDNIARRNRMYEHAGIKFAYTADAGNEYGVSRAMTTDDLIVVDSWKQNIRVLSVPEYAGALRYANGELSNDVDGLERVRAALEKENQRRESKPLRWALWRHRNALIGLMTSSQALVIYAFIGTSVALLRRCTEGTFH